LALVKYVKITQIRFRAAVRARKARVSFINLKRAALFCQRFWRKKTYLKKVHNTIVNLQASCLGFMVRCRNQRIDKAVIKIQAQWRGSISRKKSLREIQDAKDRILRAQRAFEESMTLGSITKEALRVLLSSSNLSHVKKACISLGEFPLRATHTQQ